MNILETAKTISLISAILFVPMFVAVMIGVCFNLSKKWMLFVAYLSFGFCALINIACAFLYVWHHYLRS